MNDPIKLARSVSELTDQERKLFVRLTKEFGSKRGRSKRKAKPEDPLPDGEAAAPATSRSEAARKSWKKRKRAKAKAARAAKEPAAVPEDDAEDDD